MINKSRYNGYRSQDVSLLHFKDSHEKNRYHRRRSGIRRWPSFRSNRSYHPSTSTSTGPCSRRWRCWHRWPEHRRPGCYRRSRSSCWRCCFGFELRHHPPRYQPPRPLISPGCYRACNSYGNFRVLRSGLRAGRCFPASPMKNQPFHRRLGFAWHGIVSAWRSEMSMRQQSIAAVGVLLTLLWLRPAPVWWALLSLNCGLVLAAELFNSALEHALDHLHPTPHPAIGLAKDCAAGAVLVLSLTGVVIFACFICEMFNTRFAV